MSRTSAKIASRILFAGMLLLTSRIPANAQATATFQTFVVSQADAQQSSTKVASKPSKIASSTAPSSTTKPDAAVHAQLTATIYPGHMDLEETVQGIIEGGQVDTRSQVDGPWNGRASSESNFGTGYLDFQRNGAGFRLGAPDVPGLESMSGVRLFGENSSSGVSTGLGLYRRIGGAASFEPAVDTQWENPRERFSGGMLVAADSSWSARQQYHSGLFQFNSFAGTQAGERGANYGVGCTRSFADSTTLFGGLTRDSGFSSENTTLGASRQFGRSSVSLLQMHMRQTGIDMHEDMVFAISPWQQKVVSLQFQHGSQTGTGASQNFNSLQATVFDPIDAKTTLLLGRRASVIQDDDAVTHSGSTIIGINHTISGACRFETSVEFGGQARSLRNIYSSIDYRVNRLWGVRLLCSPMQIGPIYSNCDCRFGIQLIRNMSIEYTPRGSVSGQISMDDQSQAKPFDILVDDDQIVKADSHGRFRAGGLAEGTHTFEIAPQSLSAYYDAKEGVVTSDVKAGKPSLVLFHVYRVGSIAGQVTVRPDQFGQIDPTANIGVVVRDDTGRMTTTDETGRFNLGDLPLGSHRLTVDASSLPPGFQIVGNNAVETKIDLAPPPAPISFTIGVPERQVDFQQASASVAPAHA